MTVRRLFASSCVLARCALGIAACDGRLAPSTDLVCTESLESKCTPEPFVPCPATWSPVSCAGTEAEQLCANLLVMPASDPLALCAYDSVTHALAAWMAWAIDTPTWCAAGASGQSVPNVCVSQWSQQEVACARSPAELSYGCPTCEAPDDAGSLRRGFERRARLTSGSAPAKP